MPLYSFYQIGAKSLTMPPLTIAKMSSSKGQIMPKFIDWRSIAENLYKCKDKFAYHYGLFVICSLKDYKHI